MSAPLKLGSTGVRVIALQGALRQLIDHRIKCDGEFGPLTEAAVEAYQCSACLTPDGVAGEITHAAIEADSVYVPQMRDFRGRIGVLVALEGFVDRPYVPSKQKHRPDVSGLTIGYGLDVGHQSRERARELLVPHFDAAELELVLTFVGLNGPAARSRFEALSEQLRRIRITRSCAAKILAKTCPSYWRAAVKALPGILHESAPQGVHTAALSLVYHSWLKYVDPLKGPAAAHDWSAFADAMRALEVYPERREREAALIS